MKTNEKKYFAIASLVLGIIAVIGTFIATDATEYLFGLVGIISGILGIKSEKKNLAIAGISFFYWNSLTFNQRQSIDFTPISHLLSDYNHLFKRKR